MPLDGLSFSRQLELDREDTAVHDDFNARHELDDEVDMRNPAESLTGVVHSFPTPDLPPPPSPQSEVSNASNEPPQKKLKGTTSPVWDHFSVSIVKGVKYVKCKHCTRCKYTDPSGTTTMMLHLSKHHPGKIKPPTRPPVPKEFQPVFSDTPKISKEKETAITDRLKRWIVCSAKPFNSVDCPHFTALINECNAAYKVKNYPIFKVTDH